MSGWPNVLPNAGVAVLLPDEKRQLIVDLLHGHIITLGMHKETIADIPELAQVAEEGMRKIDAQITLAHETLSLLA